MTRSMPLEKQQLLPLLALILFFLPGLNISDAQPLKVEFETEDNLVIRGNLWKQEGRSPAIMLLHQCDSDQRMYSKLANMIYDKGFHVLTFDYRGIGESASKEYDLETTKDKNAFWSKFMSTSASDMSKALSFFSDEVDILNLSMLGASCGGDKAIKLAVKTEIPVAALGFLSARLSQNSLGELDTLDKLPVLFVAARDDKSAYAAAQKAMEANDHPQSKSYYYQGYQHGFPLFQIDKMLEENMANWFYNAVTKN